jgi:hypothetical protein
VRALYDRLVNRGNPKMKDNAAVMRKLLHASYGVFKTDMGRATAWEEGWGEHARR